MPDDLAKRYIAPLKEAVNSANAFAVADQVRTKKKQGEWAAAQKLCKSKHLGVLANVTARIERNLGHGAILLRLIGTNQNICGTPDEVQKMTLGEPYLPVSGLTNPKPGHCGKMFAKSLRKMKVQYDDGFQGDVMLWQALSEREVKALPKQLGVLDKYDPSWSFCP